MYSHCEDPNVVSKKVKVRIKFWFLLFHAVKFFLKIRLNILQYSMFTRSDYRFLSGSTIQQLQQHFKRNSEHIIYFISKIYIMLIIYFAICVRSDFCKIFNWLLIVQTNLPKLLFRNSKFKVIDTNYIT